MEVKVPENVAIALDYHKETCKNMTEDTLNLMLIAVPFSTVHGRAATIKDYATKHPTTYIKAIANGYEPEINVQDELTEMITVWLNKPYVDDEKRDVKNFAKMVTKYFQQQL